MPRGLTRSGRGCDGSTTISGLGFRSWRGRSVPRTARPTRHAATSVVPSATSSVRSGCLIGPAVVARADARGKPVGKASPPRPDRSPGERASLAGRRPGGGAPPAGQPFWPSLDPLAHDVDTKRHHKEEDGGEYE